MSVYEAVRAYTVEGAYASGEEDVKGRIREGMLADFIVLSEDIFEVETRRIRDIQVLETYVGGRPVME